MSRYIDADALKKSIDNCDICNICPDKNVRCDYDCDFPDFLTPKWETLIDSVPSIDIVRCKECKHWLNNSGLCKHWSKLYGSVLTNADDFCSYGERKESE